MTEKTTRMFHPRNLPPAGLVRRVEGAAAMKARNGSPAPSISVDRPALAYIAYVPARWMPAFPRILLTLARRTNVAKKLRVCSCWHAGPSGKLREARPYYAKYNSLEFARFMVGPPRAEDGYKTAAAKTADNVSRPLSTYAARPLIESVRARDEAHEVAETQEQHPAAIS